IEMDALESSERANRRALDARMSEIKLHNFVAWCGTTVGYANGNSDCAVRGDLSQADLRVGIIEGRKTQPVAERIERLLGEVAIRAAGHGIVSKRRKLHDGLIKCHRKSSRRIVIAGKNIRDGRATLLTGIPGFDDGGGVLLRPVHRQRAAVCENNDQRLARGSDGFEKLFLRPWKIEVQAIAAEKAGITGVTFLAFELRGDADHGDDDIRLASGAHGVFRQIRRQPEESRRGFPPAVEVLDSNRISMTSLKMNQRGHRARAMGRGVIDKLFSIQVNAVTAVGVCTQTIVAVHR